MTYPDVVKNYLERKYGKKFIVDPKDYSYGGSPIPFYHGCYTATYYVYENDDPDYTFIVEVTPVSVSDASIKEIRDSYCWKFLREKLRRKIEKKIDETLTEEYKVFVSIYGGTTFENYVTPDSQIEDKLQPRISICVFASENKKVQNKK
ncbi:hypothetical protein [Clostridium sp. Marseille-P2415]|uniref:hypothetical protein n=1 Tax=Clostridium sp. Marseille-P2415 TaxID=1805471 RepID=UPI0009885549|nr:hypothetical protein [Clostridium sp. Marseille-P2415]